ncbi:hypothetical protein HDV05_008338 [Chytridiales sp. JEL 0842]|nr:hypothetical protein HDV05_008338 [Chytridiales sp. JEL 0842]
MTDTQQLDPQQQHQHPLKAAAQAQHQHAPTEPEQPSPAEPPVKDTASSLPTTTLHSDTTSLADLSTQQSTESLSNNITEPSENPHLEVFETEEEIVTEAMQEEEKRMEAAYEKERRERLKMQNHQEFDAHIADQRRNRLNFLITQAGAYSTWLASRLELRQKELTDGKSRTLVSTEDGTKVDGSAVSAQAGSGKGKKRKAGGAAGAAAKKAKGQAVLAEMVQSTRASPREKKGSGDTSGAAVAKQPRSHRQPSLVTGCTLRDYQIIGVEWLISLWEQGLNGILADEMGLGKTLQTISFLAHLIEMKVWGPFLIVSPLSTLANWMSEIARFAPTLKAVLYHGHPTERAAIRKNRLSILNEDFPIVVTSYEMVINDRKYLQKIRWKYIIVDEGHRLKNMNCRLIKELKTYTSANRLILSGTPLQNNLAELWSLLNFLMPDIFENLEDFESWFNFDDLEAGAENKILDKESEEQVVSKLHQILKPFLLRRVKSEVEVDLPKKKEYLVFAPLMPKQKELYDACVRGVQGLRDYMISKVSEDMSREASSSSLDTVAVDKGSDETLDESKENDGGSDEDVNEPRKSKRQSMAGVSYNERVSDAKYFKQLEKKAEADEAMKGVEAPKDVKQSATRIVNNQKLQNLLMQLRKICNHPYIFDLPNEDVDKELNTFAASATVISTTKTGERRDEVAVRLPDIVASSGKMLLLERMLPQLFSRGHKVLIFSQMTRMLDIIADWFEFIKGWKFCRIDGNVTIDERRKQIHDFNTDKDIRVFLLSTRAGGLGINLTSADTVIIFDSDWNPQMDLQAQDRVHRIGQTKPVVVYRLVTNGTIEKKILDRATSKRKLEKLVIHKSEFKGNSRYYKTNKRVLDLTAIAEALASDDTESVTLSSVDQTSVNGDMILLNRVISDEDLNRILDRSPEAFERKSMNNGTGSGAVSGKDTPTEGEAESVVDNARFREVEETRDEGNDLLRSLTASE